jgi:hypothetical protein
MAGHGKTHDARVINDDDDDGERTKKIESRLPLAISKSRINSCLRSSVVNARTLTREIYMSMKRGDSPEIDAHGKEAVNFQLSMLIYNLVAGAFCLVLVGFVFLAVLWVLNAVFVIIAAIQASDGAAPRSTTVLIRVNTFGRLAPGSVNFIATR